jgi:hypothetical protein
MSAPLPRVFEESVGGKAVPVPSAPGQNGNIGGDFRMDEITRVSKETVRISACLQPTACRAASAPILLC